MIVGMTVPRIAINRIAVATSTAITARWVSQSEEYNRKQLAEKTNLTTAKPFRL